MCAVLTIFGFPFTRPADENILMASFSIRRDLGNNNITRLPKNSFDTVPHLEEL